MGLKRDDRARCRWREALVVTSGQVWDDKTLDWVNGEPDRSKDEREERVLRSAARVMTVVCPQCLRSGLATNSVDFVVVGHHRPTASRARSSGMTPMSIKQVMHDEVCYKDGLVAIKGVHGERSDVKGACAECTGSRRSRVVPPAHLVHNVLQRRDRRDARQVLASGSHSPIAPLSFPPDESALNASCECTSIVAVISNSRDPLPDSAYAFSSSPTINTPSPGTSLHA